MRPRLLCVAVAVVLLGAVPRPFTFDDMKNVVSVSDPQIAPNGQEVVIVVRRTNMAKDTMTSQLVLVNVASGAKRVLTAREGVNTPRWSPEGRNLAFVAPYGEKPKQTGQVWIMPMNGGDARVLTSAPNGVETYAWRPDGKAVVYQTPDDPRNKAQIAKHDDLFTVGDQDFLSKSAPVASHVWLVPAAGGKAVRLTSGSWSLPSGQFTGSLSWSADGKYLAFSRLPDAYNGHLARMHAAVLDLANKQVRDLTAAGVWSSGPLFAPKGDRIAYSVAPQNLWAFQNDVAVARLGGTATVPTAVLNRDVTFTAWMPDGGGLIAGADDRATAALWRVQLDGPPSRIALRNVLFGGAGTVAGNGSFAFVGATPRDPSELYLLGAGAATPRRLTAYNAPIAALDLGKTVEFSWHNDGMSEDGALTYPSAYRRGEKYPLVLVIHGGPTEAASTLAFDPFVQVLAGKGYVVLQPNYRGSDNLGLAYAKALRGDVDAGPGSDIVAGVKALVATGAVDPARIGVSGWSGGGLLTSWLIGHYGIWRAAVSGAAVDDFVEEYDLSDVYDYMPALMGGLTPWTPAGRRAYLADSPITYAADVTTPLLILSDTGDYRVPSVQAYAFYHALKDDGKTVQFVAIPAYGHFPSDPVRRLETYKRWAAWMNKYLRP